MGTSHVEPKKNGKRRHWYQNYLPFIARNPEMQVEWLVSECRKKQLAQEELTPYVRLLFSPENVANDGELVKVLEDLSPQVQLEFVQIADIYDVPRIIEFLPHLNAEMVEAALTKELPPYEAKPQKLLDAVLNAVNDRSEQLLIEVADRIMANGSAPSHFVENYERFRAILEDKEFIRSQWPNAK